MTAEPAAPANKPSSSPQSTALSTKQQRRQQLQQKCIEPSALDSATLEEAWLFLLGITEDHIQAHISTLQNHMNPEQAELSSSSIGSKIVEQFESSSIPLDKDGWQVANEEILRADGGLWRELEAEMGKTDSAAANDDGWKVVKSKKSRRKREDGECFHHFGARLARFKRD